MNKTILSIIVSAIVVGGGAFYGGMKYSESESSRGQFLRTDLYNLSPEERQQRLQELGANAGSTFRNGGGMRGGGGGFVGGEIISKDDKSVTIKLRDGGSRIIFHSDSTEITKSTTGSLSDLTVGNNITVNGTANSDGSVTAQMIQMRLFNKSE